MKISRIGCKLFSKFFCLVLAFASVNSFYQFKKLGVVFANVNVESVEIKDEIEKWFEKQYGHKLDFSKKEEVESLLEFLKQVDSGNKDGVEDFKIKLEKWFEKHYGRKLDFNKKEEAENLLEFLKQVDVGNKDGVEDFKIKLEKWFEKHYGRKLDFNKKEEAENLYAKLKEFLDQVKNVEPQDLEKEVEQRIREGFRKDVNVENLNREEFENYLKSSPNSVKRFFVSNYVYKAEQVQGFKNKEYLTDLQKLKLGHFDKLNESNVFYNQGALDVSNMRELKELGKNSAGPWKLFCLGEFSVDLSKLKIIDSDYLEELVTLLKYEHPQEFGFVDEIRQHVNEQNLRNYHYRLLRKFNEENKRNGKQFYSEEQLKKEVEEKVIDDYLYAGEELFSNKSQFLQAKYKEFECGDYLDFIFHNYDEEKEKQIREITIGETFNKEVDKFYQSVGLMHSSGSDEDFDIKSHIYHTNKNFAIISHQYKKFLAKLLGYDVIFYKIDPEESELAGLNIPQDEANGRYEFVNFADKVVVCNEMFVEERVVEKEKTNISGQEVEMNVYKTQSSRIVSI